MFWTERKASSMVKVSQSLKQMSKFEVEEMYRIPSALPGFRPIWAYLLPSSSWIAQPSRDLPVPFAA